MGPAASGLPCTHCPEALSKGWLTGSDASGLSGPFVLGELSTELGPHLNPLEDMAWDSYSTSLTAPQFGTP